MPKKDPYGNQSYSGGTLFGKSKQLNQAKKCIWKLEQMLSYGIYNSYAKDTILK